MIDAKNRALNPTHAVAVTSRHVGFEKLKRAGGLDFIYVPYSGGGPAINALLDNHVTAVLAEYAPLSEHLKSGALGALASTSGARIPFLPEAPNPCPSPPFSSPTFAATMLLPEPGGGHAAAGTPRPVVRRLQDEVMAVIRLQELRERLTANQITPVGSTSEDFAEKIARELVLWSEVAKVGHIQMQQ